MPIFPSRPGPSKFRLVPVEFAVIPPIPVPESTEYGLLYNWYAATDARNVCANEWHVPTLAELITLQTYLGGSDVAGGKLKEVGFIYWRSPNSGATNEVGFNGRGSGERIFNGSFTNMFNYHFSWLSTDVSVDNAYFFALYFANDNTIINNNDKNAGYSIHPIKNFTTLSPGEIGSYTDPSGYIYPTICIGTQEWVSCNIKTQHYRNGDSIPEITDTAAWGALASGALCAYNNNWDNV